MQTVSPWATKHRPRKLEEVVGQEDAVARLRGAIKRKSLPNAILICGPTGTGKTTLARLFSRYINCDTNDACGSCPSCLSTVHPDVEEINGADARGIDEVRGLVQRARYKPQYKTRVFIVDEAHQFSPQAMQAFLKPLEEPPPNTMYILCTTDPQKFPGSVVNRCLVVTVNLPEAAAVASRLGRIAKREKLAFPGELYLAIAQASNGHVREAVNSLESAANALADNPKLPLEKLLQIAAQHADTETHVACMKFLLALYLDKHKTAVKMAFAFTDIIPAVNQCIWFNEYVLAKVLGINTRHVFHSPANREFGQKALALDPVPTIEKLLSVQRRLVALRNELTTVSTKEITTLLSHLGVP